MALKFVMDDLRSLGVFEDGVPLPNIVVIGDLNSRKQNLLESLAGMNGSLKPKLAAMVPMLLKLQEHREPDFRVECGSHSVSIKEEEAIADAIVEATKETGMLKLTVKKPGVPNICVVDLPSIKNTEDMEGMHHIRNACYFEKPIRTTGSIDLGDSG